MPRTAFLQTLFEIRPQHFRPVGATIRTLGLLGPLAWGAASGHILWGVLGSLGALYAGLASYGNVHRVRLRRMVLTTVVVAALALIGALARSSDVATIAAVGAAGFVFSLYGASSATNSIVGILGVAILIIVSGLPDSGATPVEEGFMVLAGGVVESVLLLLAGPLFPRSVERRAVADAYASLARYVEGLDGEVGVPDAAPFHYARARVEEGIAHHLDDEHRRLRHALRAAETVRAALVGFARARRETVAGGGEAAQYAGRVSVSLSDALADLAAAAAQGRYNVLATLPAEPHPGAVDLLRWVDLLNEAFQDAARPPADDDLEAPEAVASGFRPLDAAAELWRSATLRPLTLAHSLRFGLTLAVGAGIYRFAHIPLGYWIPLTVAFLLRPDYSTTVVKGFARFVGTFGGVVVASAAAYLIAPDPRVGVALAVVGGWFAFALYEVSFTLYIGALTFYVVLGISAQGQPHAWVGMERTLSTAAGVVLAAVATLAWPIWESGKLKAVLREAFLAQVEYGEALVRLGAGGPVAGAEAVRHKTRLLRVEAERLLAAATVEPKWSRKAPVADADAQVRALNENAAVLLSLHAEALAHRAGRIPDAPRNRADLQHAISTARVLAER